MDLAALLEQRSHGAGFGIDLGDRPLPGVLSDLPADEKSAAHRPVEIVGEVAERKLGVLRGAAVPPEPELDDALLAELGDEEALRAPRR